MIKIGKWTGFFLLLLCVSAKADVKVFATVDTDTISQGDGLLYSVNVTTDGELPTFDKEPELDVKGLNLIGKSSSTQAQSTFINGKMKVQQTRTFDYQFAAPQKGKFTIGATKVSIAGKIYQTNPIQITVQDAGKPVPPQARKGQVDPDPFDEAQDLFLQLMRRRGRQGVPGQQGEQLDPKDAFFIDVKLDKTKVYAGEQITAGWYLYTRGQIADIDTLKYPDLKGFWKEEIEMATRLNFQQEIINGVVWQKALLVSYALFPYKAGKASVDPYQAKCTIVAGGPFGFGRAVPAVKSSKAIEIEVLEVPKEGRPANYTGAVGQFQVSTTLDPAVTTTNQPVTLKVKFSGKGNAKSIDLPALNLPSTLEVYSNKAESKFFKDGTSYKEFEILLIPREPGTFKIPAVQASYFDPELHKFNSIESNEMEIQVTPGKAGTPAPPQADIKPEEKKPETDMPPPLTMEAASSHMPKPIRNIIWFAIFGGLAIYLLVRTYKVFFKKQKRETLEALIKARMRNVQNAINAKDWRRVGVELTNSIYLILGEIADQGGANLEFDKLMAFASPSLRRELGEPLRRLLDQTEVLGFAPDSAVGLQKQPSELAKLKAEVEKALFKAVSLR